MTPPRKLSDLIFGSAKPVALPIAVHPGIAITGTTVRDIVTSAKAQFEASSAVHEEFRTPVVLSAMDLSAEAEIFGSEVLFADDEVPTVVGRRVRDAAEARTLPVPRPGEGRTGIYLDTVRRLSRIASRPIVLAGCIGPFSLAGRLFGMNETFDLSVDDPDTLDVLLEKIAAFLVPYLRAFKAAGADGAVMAEPAAGLLSPRALGRYSSKYIRGILAEVEEESFHVVLHNCGAKLIHLPQILESGASAFHFGNPMDLPGALAAVSEDTIVCGNLDPSSVFCQLGPEDVAARTRALLDAVGRRKNHVPSSGCDIPARAPLANLRAFFEAVRS